MELRTSDSITEFKKMLKTFLFRKRYDLSNLVINPPYAVQFHLGKCYMYETSAYSEF